MFLNWMPQSKALNPENFNNLAINLKQHASKQELHGGNHGENSASKSTGKYTNLVPCGRGWEIYKSSLSV